MLSANLWFCLLSAAAVRLEECLCGSRRQIHSHNGAELVGQSVMARRPHISLALDRYSLLSSRRKQTCVLPTRTPACVVISILWYSAICCDIVLFLLWIFLGLYPIINMLATRTQPLMHTEYLQPMDPLPTTVRDQFHYFHRAFSFLISLLLKLIVTYLEFFRKNVTIFASAYYALYNSTFWYYKSI